MENINTPMSIIIGSALISVTILIGSFISKSDNIRLQGGGLWTIKGNTVYLNEARSGELIQKFKIKYN